MRKLFKTLLFLVLFCAAGAMVQSCDDPVEELRAAGCAPNLPGWPGCLEGGDDKVFGKR